MDRKDYYQHAQNLLPIALPFLLFLVHAHLFAGWIIDDAGISFVYSRNLAHGYGLVSQPGMNPVEGFSNFTWVLLMTPFFVINKFDPIATPKIVSFILILAVFITVREALKLTSKYSNLSTFFILFFLSTNTAFVIWTTSGLENPLYTLIISLILLQAIKFERGTTIQKEKSAIYISILAAICALTRPDGILYSAVFPALIYAEYLKLRKIKTNLQLLLLYLGGFALIFGSYVVFRYLYFEDVVPNTYYAKGGITLDTLAWQEKINILLNSIGLTKYLLTGLMAMLICLMIIKKETSIAHYTLFIMLVISIFTYVALPQDWMPEFRFATPFFLLFYLFIYLTSEMLYTAVASKKIVGILITLLLILLASNSLGSFYKRSHNFAKSPTVPFTVIAEVFGYRFNEYAHKLDIDNGSLLVPGLGGTLYYSQLRVYDLAGLADKVIGRSLGRNPKILHDYVFETVKPTFIHTHEAWTYLSNFDADPRFREDYIPIYEITDIWILEGFGVRMFSGDYVRKDAIKNFEALKEIQANYFQQ